MEKSEEGFVLQLRLRPGTTVSLQIPVDTLASLEKVAASRDMSLQALIKFYIGQGLRQDLAKLFADRVLEKTAQVLTRHIPSEEEISSIIREICTEAVV
ncbi:hypothetical protein FJZ31_38060 [Candidatus Poribacteria bacterium]|nr:hypothetical protein [Candidatus Poribacteria bacterium]